MGMPIKVFQFVFEDTLPTLQAFVTQTSSTMASIAGAAGSTLFALYILFWGMAIVTGRVQEPFSDGFSRIMRGVVILAFATSAGIYSDWVVAFFTEVPGAIAAEIARAGSSGGNAATNSDTTAQMLDVALDNGLKAGQAAWERASTFNIFVSVGYGLIAICIWLFVGCVCAYAGAMVLLANLGLSVMLGLGPLFILCAMFEATKPLFVAWTRQVITFAVFFLVLAATVTLTFSFFNPFMEQLANSSGDVSGVSNIVKEFLMLVCFCGLSIIVLWQSTSWASGLAGGVSVAGAGAVGRMASTFGAGAIAGTVAANGARRAVLRSEFDKDKENSDGSRGGKVWRGAAPSAAQGMAKGAAYMRRNQIRRT